jgi:catechol 2,3-dioxygenase-like lactoylglutathione lyase family enzyme
MLDHVGIEVSDLAASRMFYEAALAPLGIKVVMEFEGMLGFGKDEKGVPFFWVASRGRAPVSGVHVAFGAREADQVDAFHAAAIAAGGTDNGATPSRLMGALVAL